MKMRFKQFKRASSFKKSECFKKGSYNVELEEVVQIIGGDGLKNGEDTEGESSYRFHFFLTCHYPDQRERTHEK